MIILKGSFLFLNLPGTSSLRPVPSQASPISTQELGWCHLEKALAVPGQPVPNLKLLSEHKKPSRRPRKVPPAKAAFLWPPLCRAALKPTVAASVMTWDPKGSQAWSPPDPARKSVPRMEVATWQEVTNQHSILLENWGGGVKALLAA